MRLIFLLLGVAHFSMLNAQIGIFPDEMSEIGAEEYMLRELVKELNGNNADTIRLYELNNQGIKIDSIGDPKYTFVNGNLYKEKLKSSGGYVQYKFFYWSKYGMEAIERLSKNVKRNEYRATWEELSDREVSVRVNDSSEFFLKIDRRGRPFRLTSITKRNASSSEPFFAIFGMNRSFGVILSDPLTVEWFYSNGLFKNKVVSNQFESENFGLHTRKETVRNCRNQLKYEIVESKDLKGYSDIVYEIQRNNGELNLIKGNSIVSFRLVNGNMVQMLYSDYGKEFLPLKLFLVE